MADEEQIDGTEEEIDEQQGQEEEVEEQPQEEPGEEPLLFGKYKTMEDAMEAFEKLERKVGEQGNRLAEYEGNARKQIDQDEERNDEQVDKRLALESLHLAQPIQEVLSQCGFSDEESWSVGEAIGRVVVNAIEQRLSPVREVLGSEVMPTALSREVNSIFKNDSFLAGSGIEPDVIASQITANGVAVEEFRKLSKQDKAAMVELLTAAECGRRAMSGKPIKRTGTPPPQRVPFTGTKKTTQTGGTDSETLDMAKRLVSTTKGAYTLEEAIKEVQSYNKKGK